MSGKQQPGADLLPEAAEPREAYRYARAWLVWQVTERMALAWSDPLPRVRNVRVNVSGWTGALQGGSTDPLAQTWVQTVGSTTAGSRPHLAGIGHQASIHPSKPGPRPILWATFLA